MLENSHYKTIESEIKKRYHNDLYMSFLGDIIEMKFKNFVNIVFLVIGKNRILHSFLISYDRLEIIL